MKKCLWLVCLTIFLTFADGGVLQAAAPGAERFQPVVANDKISTSLDTQTIRYLKDPYREENLLDAWLKTIERETGGYNLSRYYFRVKERQYQMISSLDFDAEGNLLSTERNSYSSRFKDVIPETLAEKWYDAVIKYEKEVMAIKK